jgi:hypothetical protein
MSSYITQNGTYTGTLIPVGNTAVITPTYILSDASEALITKLDENIFVAPFVSRMYAGASGEVGTLTQTTVTILDIDKVFDVDLSGADAVDFLSGFAVRDMDVSSGGVDAVYDPSAHVIVSMRDGTAKDDFQAALLKALNNAKYSTTSISDYLTTETQTDVTRLLNYDGLANLLEASVLQRFGIVLDTSNGSYNMWDTMNNGTEAQRRALFTQLTEDRVHLYSTVSGDGVNVSRERVAVMNFLPLKDDDTLALVWDVIVGDYAGDNTAPTSGSVITRRAGDYAPGTTLPYSATVANVENYIIGGTNSAQFNNTNGSVSITRPTLRRIGVRIKVKTASAATAFTVATPAGRAQTGFVLSLE